LIACSIWGGSAFSLVKGPPGMAFIIKKVRVTIKKREKKIVTNRRNRNRNTLLPPSLLFG
jgi:hypothetical protein